MDRFDIWGQMQEISAGRILVIATACPLASGRQTSFSAVVKSRDVAVSTLERLIEQLREQVALAGDAVVSVNRIPSEHLMRARAEPRATSSGSRFYARPRPASPV